VHVHDGDANNKRQTGQRLKTCILITSLSVTISVHIRKLPLAKLDKFGRRFWALLAPTDGTIQYAVSGFPLSWKKKNRGLPRVFLV